MVYVFLADGFEEMEAIAPVDILRRASCDVVTVGISGDMVASSRGVSVKADVTEVNLDLGLEMIVLPGGGGYKRLESSALVGRAIDYCVENNVPIAAICAAPTILGKRGLLKGKSAVCFPGMESDLLGARLSADGVVTDGIYTTGRSAGYSMKFALRLVEVLRGGRIAAQVAKALCLDD